MSHGRKISVIGLGYVGLPVAAAFGQSEQVIGFDVNVSRIEELKSGVDSTSHGCWQHLLPVTVTFAKKITAIYTLRIQIEEGFRDVKSHRFGLGLTCRSSQSTASHKGNTLSSSQPTKV